MGSLRAPCKDCPDRHPECHGRCEKYLAFRAERDKYNEARRIEKQIGLMRGETVLRSVRADLKSKKSRGI